MNTDEAKNELTLEERESSLSSPSIYDYVDYRKFLKASYEYKKSINPSYSESAFIQAAGFGKNSRGYFGLLMKGKRNLTAKTIYGFSKALKLDAKETMYFENMVFFNQAKDEEEKTFYFQRIQVSATGKKSESLSLLESQYRYVSSWYLLALREVVNLIDFKEDSQWIIRKLKGKVSTDEVETGIQDLLNLGLLTRNQKGQLVVCDPVITFDDNAANFKNSTKLHAQFTEHAKEALINEPYEKRAAQLITLCCHERHFEQLRADMQSFVKTTLQKYVVEDTSASNTVLQLGMQLIHVTE